MNRLLVSELEEIKEFLGVGYLDNELFEEYFINNGSDIEDIYNNYVNMELSYDISVRSTIVTLEDFIKALDIKLKDRYYTETHRYIGFSDGNIYYINDNTLLG